MPDAALVSLIVFAALAGSTAAEIRCATCHDVKSATRAVVPQDVSAGHTLTVTGHVSLNGSVAENVDVVFHKVGKGSGGSGTASTSAEGAFSIALHDGPGAYAVRFYQRGFLMVGHDTTVDVNSGASPIRFDLSGPPLMVEVDGWKGDTPLVVAVTYSPRAARSVVRYRHEVRSRDDLPMRIDAVAPGAYEISALQDIGSDGSTLVTEVAKLTAESDQGPLHVILNLTRRASRVVVVGRLGEPVERARVRSGAVTLTDLGSGVFDSSPVAPGERLHVGARGFVPVCVHATPVDSATIALETGLTVRLVFRNLPDVAQPPGYLLWGGTECPVPLNELDYDRVQASSRDASEFVVRNFPTSEVPRFVSNPTGRPTTVRQLEVRADGVVEVPYAVDR